MSTPMFAPRGNYGERPGQRIPAEFVKRIQEEMYAARGTGVDEPFNLQNGPWGAQTSLDRDTVNLRRFVLIEDLQSGDAADAYMVVFDNSTFEWTTFGEAFTVYDSLGNADGSTYLKEGQYGFATWFLDNGRWEVVNSGSLTSDDFFPARIDSSTGTSPVLFAWVESEWTSTTAGATDKAGGRAGTTTPLSWVATELNNSSVADDTIVWMKRGYKPSSPADATITKTLAGNGAGVHATFSLYVDANTTSGGTYTITMDDFVTADIAFNENAGVTKSAIQTATGYTLSSFSGAGTLASPWTFTVSSDAIDHNAFTNTAGLKDKSGFRFNAGGGSAGLCGWGAMPAATGTYKIVVKQDADDCFAYIPVATCTDPFDLDGGETT